MKKLASGAAKSAAKTVAKHATKHATKHAAKTVAKGVVKLAARKVVGGLAAKAAVAVATTVATRLVAKAAKRRAARAVADLPPDLPPAFARDVRAYEGDPAVTRGVMMAAFGLKVHGKIFAMLPRGRFVVKLPRARVDDLVARGMGTRFDPGHGRLMKEWLELDGHEERWLGLAREAYEHVMREA